MNDQEIIDGLERLENAINSLPDEIPFSLIVKSFTGKSVIAVEDNTLVDEIFSIIERYFRFENTQGMQFEKPIRLRVSLSWRIIQELLEKFVEEGFENCETSYIGYPRLKLERNGTPIYITVKTSQDLSSGARTFYISKKGTEDRISADGYHFVLVLEFAMEEEEDVYYIVYFQSVALYDLSSLTLRLKPELNATPIDLIRKTRFLRRVLLD